MLNWNGKVVLITGGSAGLGLELARQFAGLGATTFILARTAESLEKTRKAFTAENRSVQTLQADVTDSQQAENAIAELIEKAGKLDILINNVGKSTRTDLKSATADRIREMFEINTLSAVNCTLPSLEHLRKTNGHLVNIGSLAAKTGWPFLTPYSVSKFGLAAYTHQLRLDGPSEIHYMFVCPGPIKRRDGGDRYDSEVADLPEHARQPGGGVKMKGVEIEILAKKIISGFQRRSIEIVYPWRSRLLFAVQQLWPKLGDWIIRRSIKK